MNVNYYLPNAIAYLVKRISVMVVGDAYMLMASERFILIVKSHEKVELIVGYLRWMGNS